MECLACLPSDVRLLHSSLLTTGDRPLTTDYWTNKAILVTGGSAGLGLAIAKAFAAVRARVAIVGRDRARLDLAVDELRAEGKSDSFGIAADITRQDDVGRAVEEVVAKFGKLDGLVNCAGQSMRGELLTTPPEEFQRLFEINVVALVRMTQACAPYLIASRGHIVNIGSLASKSAARFLGAYPASKFPVAAISQQLRLELGPQGVHTLLVCPGPLRRDDAGDRYDAQSANLPPEARQPGGGVKIKGIDPDRLAAMILRACERRQSELVVPWKAKLLFAISQMWPGAGDWLVKRLTSG